MGHTNSTPNLHLPQFVGSDKPTWLSDVNGAMLAIDTAYGTIEAQASSAATAAAGAVTVANAAQTAADGAASAAATAGTNASQALSTANNAATTANNAYNKAESVETALNTVTSGEITAGENVTLESAYTFCRKRAGVVIVTIRAHASAAIAQYAKIAELPSGYRPYGSIYTNSVAGASQYAFTFNANGDVTTSNLITNGDLIEASVSFIAEN